MLKPKGCQLPGGFNRQQRLSPQIFGGSLGGDGAGGLSHLPCSSASFWWLHPSMWGFLLCRSPPEHPAGLFLPRAVSCGGGKGGPWHGGGQGRDRMWWLQRCPCKADAGHEGTVVLATPWGPPCQSSVVPDHIRVVKRKGKTSAGGCSPVGSPGTGWGAPT